ncbi:TPA: single-stranded DNA-binding protein [Streptococcus suis]
MEQELININANLIKDPVFSTFEKDGEEVPVANFTLVKKYGKGKEYINCSAYGEKVEIAKEFEKGDFIHIFGYFKENRKGDKVYRNFIVKSMNKISQEEDEEEDY